MDFSLLILLGSIMLAITLISAILVAGGVRWYLDEQAKKKEKLYKFIQQPKVSQKPRHNEWADEDEFEADFDHMFEQFQKKFVRPNVGKPIKYVQVEELYNGS